MLYSRKVVVNEPQPFTRKAGHHPASRRWGHDSWLRNKRPYEGSWKLRLHRTSPVVGSERTCDDVELFRSIEYQELTMAVVVNPTLTKEVDWESWAGEILMELRPAADRIVGAARSEL